MENGKWKMNRSATLSCIIFLALLPFIFFWRETLGWLTLGDQDAVFWFFPAFTFIAEQLKSGNLPLWTIYQYSGAPLFAQWHAGVLDPINWIYLIETSSRTLTISQEIGFALALFATFVYTRSLGFHRRACVISAVIYALSGFAVARTLYPCFLHITALAPLVLYFVERLYQRGKWRDVAAGALIIAWQIFAAHAQPLVYSSLLACAYALFRWQTGKGKEGDKETRRQGDRETERQGDKETGEQGENPHKRKFLSLSPCPLVPLSSSLFLLQFTLMFITGAALAAVQLIPAFETAGQSVRREWPYDLFTMHSLHPISLLTTLFPFFHGSGKTIYQLPYWGNYWHHNEAQFYLGLPAISLAIAGAIFAWRSSNRIAIFWSLVAVVGIILSLGKYSGPIARMLFHIPLISHFRSPNRHWMEVSLAVAVLAGYAIDRILQERSRELGILVKRSAVILLLLCCAVAGFLLWRRQLAESIIRRLPDLDRVPEGFLQAAGSEFYLPVIFAVCGALALILFVRARRPAYWYWPLLVLLLIDFNHYATFAPINSPAKLETLIGQAMPASLAARQSKQDPIRYHVMLNPAAGEFSSLWFHGHEMATGYDPILNDRYKTFSGIDEAGRSFHLDMLQARDRTLDLLNVHFVLVAPTIFETSAGLALRDGTRWREVDDRSLAEPYRDYRAFKNLNALPRAWLVDQVKIAYEGDQHKLIRGEIATTGERDFDPRTTALVDHETAGKLDEGLLKSAAMDTAPQTSPPRIIDRNATRMLIEADGAKPSVLVLSEISYPGWKVEVDGKAAQLLRVNYDLRGVALSAGKHRVELIYRPRSLRIGAAVSLITGICLLLVIWLERRRSYLTQRRLSAFA
jgi:Bacterial membrane protein YfhO